MKLPSHEVYQPEESRDKIKTQKVNAYKKILKLTPESSRYLFGGVGDRDKNGREGNGMVKEERASAVEGRSEIRPPRLRGSAPGERG